MTAAGPTLLVFHGGFGKGPAETAVSAARLGATQKSINNALAAGFDQVIVATDSPSDFQSDNAKVLVEADPSGVKFSFGDRLEDLVRRFEVKRPVVLGGGSLPLLEPEDFRQVAESLQADAPICVTNNFYSSDLTGWFPGSLLFDLEPPRRDNALPRLLRDQGGAAVSLLPRSTATQFDLDTPTDVAILAIATGSPGPFPHIEERARNMMRMLCDRDAEIVVAGRVGSLTWRYLESQMACRVRLISEERGLSTAPEGYSARSILGFLFEDRHPLGFFEAVARLGDAAFLDTRVLFAHFQASPSKEDRFQSDLLTPDSIHDPWLRQFTAAAAAAPGPLLVGGHSLVAGGLMALNDAAWSEREKVERNITVQPNGPISSAPPKGAA